MTQLNSDNTIPTIDFLYFKGSTGIHYPEYGQLNQKVPEGVYTSVFNYNRPMTKDQFWVVKIEELSIQESTWIINTNKNEVTLDFKGSSMWVTVGIATDFAEYVKGSKKNPMIISNTIKFEIDQGFIYVPPSFPAPSNSNVALPVQVPGLKDVVFPLIQATPTPTPSRKRPLAYSPTISQITFSTTLDSVSPILDTHLLSYTLVKNIVNDYSDVFLIATESNKTSELTVTRYITKPIKLLPENTASGFFISFAANIPNEAKVFIFHKIFNTVEDLSLAKFEDQPWIFNNSTGERKSINKTEFLDFDFQLDSISYPGNNSITSFDMFSIKLVMISSNAAKIPKIKDFRVMAHS